MQLFDQYGDDVQFFVVYISEAHALDGASPMGGDGMPLVEEPKTLEEREAVAKVCLTKLELKGIPALVDDMDDTANLAYEAGPDRLYLIGRDGRVAYKGGPGPFMFLPDELDKAIRKELALRDQP